MITPQIYSKLMEAAIILRDQTLMKLPQIKDYQEFEYYGSQ